MKGNVNSLGGIGFENQCPTLTRTYVRAPANSVSTAATLAVGAVVVQDDRERGAATIGGVTRSAVAGAPNYTVNGSASDVRNFVAVADAAVAARAKAYVVVDPAGATAGQPTKVASLGRVTAIVYGHDGSANAAIGKGDRLSISVVASNLGRFKLAAANEMVSAIALQTVASGATASIEVELIEPFIATQAGNA